MSHSYSNWVASLGWYGAIRSDRMLAVANGLLTE